MSGYRQDEARYWPYCMIEISNRKDLAEACGGPTFMSGQPDWPMGAFRLDRKAFIAPPEIKAYLGVGYAALAQTPPPDPPPRSAA